MPSRLKDFNQAREFPQRKPVNPDAFGIAGGAEVHLRVCFFLNGGDNDAETLGARGIEEEKRKTPVACNQAETVLLTHAGYLMTPRSLFAMNSAR